MSGLNRSIAADWMLYRRPHNNGGDSMVNKPNTCECGCQKPEEENKYPCPPPNGYWYPAPPPPPYYNPCECAPVAPATGSIEAQIAKLSKKSATIRKMIDALVNRNKSIIISIGCSSYNFGEFTADEEETTYGAAVLEMLQTELEAIKAKIVELTAELEVEDTSRGEIEKTVL